VNPKHTECRSNPASSSSSPKRLLDVGRVMAPIRLIDTQGKNFEYTALSHCWGTGPTLTATKSNWKKLATNVSFDALPPLFQDAVIITRQLGLRYIWIDSLCIIQDSVRDWETESAKMGGIYESSYVTISATNSGDGTTRCLAERRKAVKLNYENTTKKEFALRARLVEDHHPDIHENEPARLSGRLTSRSWALQEHVLSTRILHYTATELLFECKTSCRCECSPSRKILPTTPALIPKAITRQKKHRHSVWDAWHRTVEQYSMRDLTVSNDKLPAISGIAGKIKDCTNSPYLAGIWEQNLASDLLWSTSPTAMPDAHYFALDTYRAPSFSWASLNTPVNYYTPDHDERRTFKPSVTLISSSVAVAGLDPLGRITNAAITLQGPTIHALLCSTQRDGMWEYALLIKGTSAIRISHDCLLVENTAAAASKANGSTIRRAHCGDKPSEFKAVVLCLGIARYDTWTSGLVLGSSSKGDDSWERLGTFAAGMEAFQRAEERVVKIV
jgi:hypothetical protein